MNELKTVMSQCIKGDIHKGIYRSNYVAVLCDETTDISIKKQLIVYICYVCDNDFKVHYLKIKDMKDGSAEIIEDELLNLCQEKELNLSKVVGFGSDRASVMMGSNSGVATRLKSHNPSLISVHCIAHCLALAVAQAADSILYLKILKIVSQIYYYYNNSAVRSASLNDIWEVDPVLKTKATGNTCWLSHDHVISTIRRILLSLIGHLEKEAAEKGDTLAIGLVCVIKTYYFVASTYLFRDVLSHLSRLSRLFQERDIDFSKIQLHVRIYHHRSVRDT